jgi:hypothetical protein
MTTTLTSSIALLSAGLGLATMLSSTLPAASAGAVDVNIVAHPDDDIFFMNPTFSTQCLAADLDNQLCPFINGLYVLNQDSSDSTTRYQCQNGNGVDYGFNAFDVSQSSKYGYGAWYHQGPIQVTPADVLMAPASHW